MIKELEIYPSKNCGDMVVKKYVNSSEVHVEFLNTGAIAIARACAVKAGTVKDKMHPSVYGVGFIGYGKFKPFVKNKISRSYRVWVDMMARCYSEYYKTNYPTYSECKVFDGWKNYQVFANWFEENYIEGYQLDKDIKISGNKYYSPDTCIFVSKIDNIVAATAKTHKFISPKGDVIEVYNLLKFCRENNLPASNMSSVKHGYDKSCRGWTAYE